MIFTEKIVAEKNNEKKKNFFFVVFIRKKGSSDWSSVKKTMKGIGFVSKNQENSYPPSSPLLFDVLLTC